MELLHNADDRGDDHRKKRAHVNQQQNIPRGVNGPHSRQYAEEEQDVGAVILSQVHRMAEPIFYPPRGDFRWFRKGREGDELTGKVQIGKNQNLETQRDEAATKTKSKP